METVKRLVVARVAEGVGERSTGETQEMFRAVKLLCMIL